MTRSVVSFVLRKKCVGAFRFVERLRVESKIFKRGLPKVPMGNLPWGSIPLLDSYLDLQVFREYWDKKKGGEHGQRFWTRLWKSKFVLFTSRGNDVCVDGVGGRVSKFLSCSSYQKYRFWSAPEIEKHPFFSWILTPLRNQSTSSPKRWSCFSLSRRRRKVILLLLVYFRPVNSGRTCRPRITKCCTLSVSTSVTYLAA